VKRAVLDAAARTRAAQRLADGSRIVYEQRTAALTAWVKAGRREDLDGWRAALGPLLRLAVLAAAACVAYAVVRAIPWLMWLLTAWLVRSAWRAAPAAQPATDAPPAEAPDEPDPGPVLALLAEVLEGRPAVHLSEVLTHLQKQGQGEGWKVADLRARFEALGIPVDPKVKVSGIPTRGVRRRDLDSRFPGWETPPDLRFYRAVYPDLPTVSRRISRRSTGAALAARHPAAPDPSRTRDRSQHGTKEDDVCRRAARP
jgi:hypothetical protein